MQAVKLIHTLRKQTRSISLLGKPDKIWLKNTNLNYAISESQPDKGILRETFFLSQLSLDHSLSLPEKGDFVVDKKFTFEVGGRGKTQKQIAEVSNGYLVKDDPEKGAFNTIPLWLFGFLY